MAQPTHFFDKLRALVEQQNVQPQQAPAPSVFPTAQPAPTEPPPPSLMPQPEPVQPPPPPSLFTPPPEPAAPIMPEPEPVPPPPPPPPPPPMPQPVQQPGPNMAPNAAPPSMNFLQDAMVNIGTPAPPPVPIVEQPSAGLIEAQSYSQAPTMPGYAMARTGSPFQAQQQAPATQPAPSLWDALGQPQQQPYSLWKGY